MVPFDRGERVKGRFCHVRIGKIMSVPLLFSPPFFLTGGLKIGYDFLLFKSFHGIKPREESGSR
jgi:hypothetical protein